MSHPYIYKVQIRNFRNLADFSLTLERTAVIVGENRTGKSNLLEALRLVLDPSLPDSLRRLRAEDFWEGLDQPFSGNIIEVKVYIRGFEDKKGAQCILADSIVGTDPLTALLTYQFRPKVSIEEVDEAGESEYEYVIFGGQDEKNRFAWDVRRWISMMALPALRDAETDIRSWRKSPLRPLLDRAKAIMDLEKLSEIREKIGEATQELVKQPAMKNLAKDIGMRIRKMAGPLHSVDVQFDFASTEPEQLLRSVQLFLEGGARSVSDASLGTANILFLSLLLQDLEAKEAANELVSTILAIEEPEAHLHPQLQRVLFRYFLGREHSVLVTTHSPNIASVAPVRSIVLLRTTERGTVGYSTRELDFTNEEIDDLQRYLDVTRAEMLFAKGVILVEGPAEQFLIQAFTVHRLRENNIAASLDELGISVCSVNGTDFRPFRKLLSTSGLSIPNVVVTDGDKRHTDDGDVYDGSKRGARLLDDKDRKRQTREMIQKGEYDKVDELLTEEGIFVGHDTLEIDILPKLSEEIKETYSEFRGETTTQKFSEAVDAAIDDNNEAIQEVVRRIEAIGKGRFAQRLASKIGDQEPPWYISEAINYVVAAVRNNNA